MDNLSRETNSRPLFGEPINMKTTFQFAFVICASLCFLGGQLHAADAPKPNIVFILADDMGYSDVGCYGGEIETPNLDRLAANGLRFTQFYNTGRCWPSRAALLSGYYPQQVNRDPAKTRPKWAALLPDLLRPAGYRSYHSGKWHVDGDVLAAGFAHSYNTIDHDRHFSPKRHLIDDKPAPLPTPDEHYYSTTAIGQHAVGWLQEHKKEHPQDPFFLYVAFIAPHFPLQAPAEDIAKYRERYKKGWEAVRNERWERVQKLGLVKGTLPPPEAKLAPDWNLKESELQKRIGPGELGFAVPWSDLTPEQRDFQANKMAVHAAMCDRVDQAVGRVVEQLKAMNALDNTLILFASDNGASAEQIIRGEGHDPSSTPGDAKSYLGLGPGWSTVSNTPFRRHKSWVHEGGIATPLIVHWPQGIAAHGDLRHAPSHLVDIVPSLLELTGATAPQKWNGESRPALPGRSLVPMLASDAVPQRDPIYFHHMQNRALRDGDWKIAAAGANAPWELYDLSTDRSETLDLAKEKPDKLKELVALWEARDREYVKQGATGGPAQKPDKLE